MINTKYPTHIVAVGGIVENDCGEILLVKHRDHKEWAFPGGQVEIGENLTDAVVREIKEESSIHVRADRLIAVSSNTSSYKAANGNDVPTKLILDFVCKYIDGEPSASDETTESKWVKKDEVLDYMTAPSYVERFKAYLNFNGCVQYLEYTTQPMFEMKLQRDI